MKPRHLTLAAVLRRHPNTVRSAMTLGVLTLAFAAANSSAATWASAKSGNWNDLSVAGWNGAYPDAVGAVATYDNTAATANGQVTQNIAAGVTVGSFTLTGTTTTATAGRSWTIVPTNAITLNQDGAGPGVVTITHSATSNNANDRLIFNAGTLTLADDLVVSKTSTTSIVANAIQLGSAIGGTGNVTLESNSLGTGNGNIHLSPAAGNTFTGSVLIRKGPATFNHAGAFGNAANPVILGESGQGAAILVSTSAVGTVPNPITVAAGTGGTLTLGSTSTATTATATTTFTGPVTANGLLTLTSLSPGTQPITFSNVISGEGGVAKTGTGTAALNGANTYIGGTSITAGTLAVGSAGTLGADTTVDELGEVLIPNTITINGGNLLLSSASNLGSHQAVWYFSGGIGVNFTPAAPIPVTDYSAAGGVFGINYTGTGGVTDLAALYNGFWSLGSFTGGTYDGTSLGAGNEALYRLGGGGGTLNFPNNVLTGANGLRIGGSGGGRINLAAANTFTGQTTVENGTVGVSAIGNVGAGPSSLGDPALPESPIVLGSGTNAVGIDYTGTTPASTDRVLKLAGTTGTVTLSNSGTAPIQWPSPPVFTGSGARTIRLGNTTDAVGGMITGIADENSNKTALTKAGLTNSTWVLTGNSHTGTTQIDGGVLEASLASLANSFLNLDGDDATRHGVLQTSGTLTRVHSATAGAANLKLGSNSGFAARGGDLTVTLTGDAQLVWGTGGFMGAGTVRLVFGSTTANGKVTFTNPINLNTPDAFQRVLYVEQGAGGDSAELSGVLSPGTATGGGPALTGINKQGNGTLILSGANTYKGATTVSAGKLLVNGDQTVATGLATVNNGATLGGSGTLGGAITVNPGGKLAPGTTVGTLNVVGYVAFTGASNFAIDIDGATADRLNVTGSLNIATAALDVTQISAPTAPVYVIANYGTIVGAAFASASGVPAGYEVVIGYNSQPQIALVKAATQTPFELWISSPPYNRTGNAALPGADPDLDGATNLLEFALGSDPTSGAATGIRFARMATVGGTPAVLTLTIAARTGATFTADGNRQQAAIDGISYTVEASNTVSDWGTPVVTAVTGDDAAAIQTTLPAPPAGWTYQTFRTDGSAPGDASEFIRVVVK
jgi:fibronectin-binding autotransporter adhesin